MNAYLNLTGAVPTESDDIIQKFNDKIDQFKKNALPLDFDEHNVYFLMNGKVFGLDHRYELFQPSNSIADRVFNKGISKYMAGAAQSLFDAYGVKYTDLKEIPNKSSSDKSLYSIDNDRIYTYNLVSQKWTEKTKDDVPYNIVSQINNIIEKDIQAKQNEINPLETHNINSEELVEIPIRYRDGCVHYYHKNTDKVFSKHIHAIGKNGNKWSENANNQSMKKYVK